MSKEHTDNEVKKDLVMNWMKDAYIVKFMFRGYRVGFTFNHKEQLRITFYFEDSDHFVREEVFELSDTVFDFEKEGNHELLIITNETHQFEEGFKRFKLVEF